MATATAAKVGDLVHVPPGELLLERNIRKPKLDTDFLNSIADVGVLQPITAVLNDEGRLVVRFGERRTLAAIEAGTATVPVYVAGDDDQADAAEVDRIIRQRDENTHRDGLTAADDLHVVEQLVAFGVPADQVHTRARMPKEQVAAAVAVSGSKLASAAAAKYESLTLDQAATVAEFDDTPDIAKSLIVTAIERPGMFAHAAQRALDDRDRALQVEELRQKLIKAQVKIIEDPGYEQRTARRLERLLDGPGGKQITTRNHGGCPGHVGWVTKYHAPEIGYGCRDPKKHGHHDKEASGSGRTTVDDRTPEQREKAKKARRLVIDNNKAWASATTVRREWLSQFAKLKTPPKGAAAFIVEAIDLHAHRLNESDGRALAGEWLGAKTKKVGYSERPDVVALTAGASEARSLHLVLIQVLAAFESFAVDNLTWRRDGKTEWHGRYLRFLESAGYTLSDVEKYAVSSKGA